MVGVFFAGRASMYPTVDSLKQQVLETTKMNARFKMQCSHLEAMNESNSKIVELLEEEVAAKARLARRKRVPN